MYEVKPKELDFCVYDRGSDSYSLTGKAPFRNGRSFSASSWLL